MSKAPQISSLPLTHKYKKKKVISSRWKPHMVEGLVTCKVHDRVPGLKYPPAYPAFLLLTSPPDLPRPPHTFVLNRHLRAVSVSAGCKCRHSMRVSAGVAFSPRAGTSFKLTGCWQTHCLVDENLRSPFPPLLTARDRSQLLESPYSSCPHGSMGSSHMDVYFLPSWRESLCLPLLQLVEKTVCFQRA